MMHARKANHRNPPTGQESTDAPGSVDPSEAERFARLAEQWWDAEGPFRPLHRLAPARLTFLRDRSLAHFGLEPGRTPPLTDLRILDVGCGGGLVTEPLARMGATVTAIDVTEETVSAARMHAAETGLDIDYRVATAESLAASGALFDLVVSLEVVEHVADRRGFLGALAGLTRPGGGLVLSTLNRTARSFALAIVGAEYVLRWLPRGTHDWRKFVKPAELAADLRSHGIRITALEGLIYSPLTDDWSLGPDLSVNYMAFAVKS